MVGTRDLAETSALSWPENYGTKTLTNWQFDAAAATHIPPYVDDPPR
jgi:hypothetical protein